MTSKILLIGAGRMGRAMAKGWLREGMQVVAVNPHRRPELEPLIADGLHYVPSLDAVPEGPFDACVIAVKPQVLRTMADTLAGIAGSGALMLSVAAGIPCAFLQQNWGAAARIVRAMPNTPGAIGHGATGLYAAPSATDADKTLAEKLICALGVTVWVEREDLIDAVIGIAGSAPAYVFALTEALARTGIALGLSADASEKLARATVSGSGALMDADPRPAADLRRDVTSPHGTTEAALKVLQGENGLDALIEATARAAVQRSQELSKG